MPAATVTSHHPKAQPRARLTQEASAQRLFAGAYRLIAKGGLASLSFSSIAQEVGCSRQLPHYHFGSKDAFVEALVDDCERVFTEYMERPMKEGLVGIPAVLGLFDSLGKLFDAPKIHRGRVLLIHELAGSNNPRLRRKVIALHAASRRTLRKILNSAVSTGDLTAADDVEALASLLHGAYRGIGFQWVVDPKSMNLPAVLAQLRRLFLCGFDHAKQSD